MKSIKIVSFLMCLLFCFLTACSNLEKDSSKESNIQNENLGEIYKKQIDCYNSDFYNDMEKINIVDGQNVYYYILLPEEKTDVLDYAAKELNNFISQSCGKNLPIVYEGDALPVGISNYISLGKTQSFENQGLSLDYSSLNNDGFFVKVIDDNFYIVGDNDRGVLYGAYDVLKRYIGLRFVTGDYTYYIKTDKILFADYDYQMAPEFAQRSFLDYNMSEEFLVRTTQYGEFGSSSIVGSPWATELGNIHTITNYVKPSVWKSSHPEFFSSYTNRNAGPENLGQEDVCYSNGITDDGKLDNTM
ncbi:MAG: hypothetical protein MJ066_06445, partial [Clostridia bacterium]|nr:hypothetical protein [Clostridia bacterium]